MADATRWTRGLALSVLCASMGLCADARAGARTVFEAAVRRKIPAGAPKASDVLLRSMVKRTASAKSPHDTMKALDDFHVTQLVWAYINDRAFVEKVKASGRVFGGAASAPSYVKPAGDPKWFEKVVIVDLDGRPIIAPWKRAWRRTLWGCVNNAELERGYVEYLKGYVDAGVQIMQRDEPGANELATRWGGCFCKHCMRAFRKWLGAHTSAEDRKRLGIVDLASFDYRAELKKAGAPVGDAFGGWNGGELKRLFVQFQTEATVAFHRRTRQALNKLAGRRVPFSCNNGVRCWSPVQLEFDWAFGELGYSHATPVYLYEAMKLAARHDRVQVVTMPKTSQWQTLDDLESRTRRTIAMATACGGHCMAPWDTYMPGDTPRYFGKPEQFADLFAFIRATGAYLDGYEEACVAGRKLVEMRYTGLAPVALAGGGDVYAVVRARPGKPGSPVVVHLVDWGDQPKPVTVRVNPACLFGSQAMRFTLLTAKPYDRAAHARARRTGDYGALIERTPLPGGYATTVAVPAVRPWGLLVIEPDPKAAPGVFAPAIAPFGGRFVGGQQVELHTTTPNAAIHYTLDGSAPTADSPRYTKPLALAASTTVKARTLAGKLSSPVVEASFTALEGVAPAKPGRVAGGLRYAYFESGCACDEQKTRRAPCPKCWRKLPDFGRLEAVRTGVCQSVGIAFEDKARRKSVNFGYRFDGYIRIARDGLYTFYTRSDDGIRLSVAGRVLVFHDGIHGAEEKEGEIALRAGLHPIRADYFQGYGGQSLKVLYSGPGVAKQEIPTDVLMHASK